MRFELLNVFFRLSDRDDDVRAVAATCLLPVASRIVERLPDSLDRVLAILWTCLRDMKDDLSSSVGAVMDLLGECSSYIISQIPSNYPQANWLRIAKLSTSSVIQIYRRCSGSFSMP